MTVETPGPMPLQWATLDRRHRRRVVVVTVLSIAVTWTVLIGVYYLVPFDDRTSGEAVMRLVLAIVGFVVVLAWQVRRITNANLPGMQAVQALGGVIPLFLLVFAAFYLSLSHSSPTSFSEPLNHTGALYLVVTVFSTVGFGDITAKTDVSRIAVSIQMLLDLVVLGTVVRLLATAAKRNRGT